MVYRKSVVATLILALALSSACASVSLKDRITSGVQATNVVVNTAQSAEEAVRTSGVVESWTPERYRGFNAALVRYYDSMNIVIDLLVTWRAGDPPPANLEAQLNVAKESIEALIKTLPPSGLDSVLSNAQTAVRGIIDLLAIIREN